MAQQVYVLFILQVKYLNRELELAVQSNQESSKHLQEAEEARSSLQQQLRQKQQELDDLITTKELRCESLNNLLYCRIHVFIYYK